MDDKDMNREKKLVVALSEQRGLKNLMKKIADMNEILLVTGDICFT